MQKQIIITTLIILFISVSCKNKERNSNLKIEFKSDSTEVKLESYDINDGILKSPKKISNQVRLREKDSLNHIFKNRIKLELIHLNDSIIQIIIDNKSIKQAIEYQPYSIGNQNIINYNNKIDLHNDYDVVMADYNFDNRIDFAILYDKTINTGTVFTYFLQSENGKFFKDKNFPLSLIPSDINKETKTLTQKNIVGCCTISTAIYQLNENNNWDVIFSEVKDMNE